MGKTAIHLISTPDDVAADWLNAIYRLNRLHFGFAHVHMHHGWWWIAARDAGRRGEVGEIVAFSGAHDAGAGRLALGLTGVLPGARGEGLQRRLLRAREAFARRRGYHELVSYVMPYNLASANNFIRTGFLLCARWDPELADDHLYFRKAL